MTSCVEVIFPRPHVLGSCVFFGGLYLIIFEPSMYLTYIEMVKRCVVGNCSNSNVTGYSRHMFPKDPISR